MLSACRQRWDSMRSAALPTAAAIGYSQWPLVERRRRTRRRRTAQSIDCGGVAAAAVCCSNNAHYLNNAHCGWSINTNTNTESQANSPSAGASASAAAASCCAAGLRPASSYFAFRIWLARRPAAGRGRRSPPGVPLPFALCPLPLPFFAQFVLFPCSNLLVARNRLRRRS